MCNSFKYLESRSLELAKTNLLIWITKVSVGSSPVKNWPNSTRRGWVLLLLPHGWVVGWIQPHLGPSHQQFISFWGDVWAIRKGVWVLLHGPLSYTSLWIEPDDSFAMGCFSNPFEALLAAPSQFLRARIGSVYFAYLAMKVMAPQISLLSKVFPQDWAFSAI